MNVFPLKKEVVGRHARGCAKTIVRGDFDHAAVDACPADISVCAAQDQRAVPGFKKTRAADPIQQDQCVGRSNAERSAGVQLDLDLILHSR